MRLLPISWTRITRVATVVVLGLTLPPPDITIIKGFLRFKASISEGRIDKQLERAIADSLNAFTERFFAGFARVTGNPCQRLKE